MRPALIVLAAAGLVAAGGPSPDAPPQTAEYGFLVGDWECAITRLAPDGSSSRDRAEWRARYILGGWAIQDEWRSWSGDGAVSHGTNIRSFDSKRGVWNNRWLASGALEWVHFDSEWKGGTMVMTGGAGRDAVGGYVDRNTFHDISPAGFAWRKDRSYDGGATWIEGVAHITCTSG